MAATGALSIIALTAACAPSDSAEVYDVAGSIVREDGAETGLCHLTVNTIIGGPVGETAEIVEEGARFLWPLPAGTYDLVANCAHGDGELRVIVPEEVSADLLIVVS